MRKYPEYAKDLECFFNNAKLMRDFGSIQSPQNAFISDLTVFRKK